MELDPRILIEALRRSEMQGEGGRGRGRGGPSMLEGGGRFSTSIPVGAGQLQGDITGGGAMGGGFTGGQVAGGGVEYSDPMNTVGVRFDRQGRPMANQQMPQMPNDDPRNQQMTPDLLQAYVGRRF